MDSPSYFDRLVASAERIAHHADYPGKEQAVSQCVEDIGDLLLAGRITDEQHDVLQGVLLGTRLVVA